jgi:hypothetical protein
MLAVAALAALGFAGSRSKPPTVAAKVALREVN